MRREVILIRHGETAWTAERRYCGVNDVPLNAKGKEEALLLRSELRGLSIGTVYSSDLRRASEFARIVFSPMKVIEDAALRELDFGQLHGMKYEEALVRFGDEYRSWIDDPASRTLPGAERYVDMVARVRRFIERVRHTPGDGAVAVVSHVGPIRVIVAELSGSGGREGDIIATGSARRLFIDDVGGDRHEERGNGCLRS